MLTISHQNRSIPIFSCIKFAVLCAVLSISTANVLADTLLDIDGSKDRLILPNIEQQNVNGSGLDKEDFELIAYAGTYGIEGFDNQPFFGLKGSIFFTTKIFLDVNYGTSYLKGITDSNISVDNRLNRYGISIAYNLLEGKAFLDSDRVLTNQLYVKYGRGNIDTIGRRNNYSTLGLGIRILGLNDTFSFHTGANHDSIDSSNGLLSGTNLKFFAGLGIYF